MSEKSVIICDLSDVLVKGLEGVEYSLAKQLHKPVGKVAEQLFNYDYTPLWYGKVSEKEFLTTLIDDFGWDIRLDALAETIYNNFYEIEGTWAMYDALAKRHTLVLYSVNCPEWVDEMKKVVNYSPLFGREFYSYDLGAHKKEVAGFEIIKQLYSDFKYYLLDDSSSNIRMAESVGITGLHFTSPLQMTEILKERGLL